MQHQTHLENGASGRLLDTRHRDQCRSPTLPVCRRARLLCPHGASFTNDFSESRSVVLSIKILPRRQTRFLNTGWYDLLGLFTAACREGFLKSQMN